MRRAVIYGTPTKSISCMLNLLVLVGMYISMLRLIRVETTALTGDRKGKVQRDEVLMVTDDPDELQFQVGQALE